MEGKRTETDKSDYSDKSDGNGALFTLNSNASEELKQQVMAMRPLVGNWLEQDGAEYARRFKEKYGLALDPEEAKLIAALAIRENKSTRQTAFFSKVFCITIHPSPNADGCCFIFLLCEKQRLST